MTDPRPTVLLSWVARNNDPYERERGGSRYARDDHDCRIPGPTMTLLGDTDSEWYGKVQNALLLYRDDKQSVDVFNATQKEVRSKVSKVKVAGVRCSDVADPTDHKAILEWLQRELPAWRARFADHRWVIHLSPGTPAMQTAWLLLAEISWLGDRPILVKSYRKRDRPDGPRVQEVDYALDTILSAHRATQLTRPVPPEEAFQLPLEKARSPRLREVLKRAGRFARLSVPILLQGERGTGKTTMASVIRAASPFGALGANWPTVACGQFSGDLIRDELFGHAKGAFSGAVADRQGLLELLDGDTLFLDEVGDIDGDTQRMLVRALEEKKFQRLGDNQDRVSRFRLVTATNRTLGELAERLDADFFDRIAAFRVTLPALREIPEDLPWLWREVYQSALERSQAESDLCRLSDDVHDELVAALHQHRLPGNLRDLLRVAWHLQAALTDRAKVGDAVTFALDALDQPGLPVRRASGEPRRAEGQTESPLVDGFDPRSQARRLAEAFARDRGLGELIDRDGQLAFRDFMPQFKPWLARRIKQAALSRGAKADELIDVTNRALNLWLEGEGPGKSGSD